MARRVPVADAPFQERAAASGTLRSAGVRAIATTVAVMTDETSKLEELWPRIPT